MKGKKRSFNIRERGKKLLNMLLCMVLTITLIPALETEVAEAATAYTTLSTYNGSGFHWNYTYQNDSETGTFNLMGNYDGNGFKFEKKTIMNVSGTNTITVTSANQMGNEVSGNAMGIYAPAGLTIGGDGTLNINITITNPTGTNEKSGIIGLYAKEMTIGENVTVNINIKTSGEKNKVMGVELSSFDGFTIQDNAHLNTSIDNGTEGDAYGIYTRSALNLNGNSVTTVEMQNNAVAGIYNGSISGGDIGKINISGGEVHVTLPTTEDSATTSYGIATNIRSIEDASISLSNGADVTVTGGRYGVFTNYQTGSGLDSFIDVQDSKLTVTDAYCGLYSNGTKLFIKNSKLTVNSKDTAVQLVAKMPLTITGNSVIQWSGKSKAIQQNYRCTESSHTIGSVNSIDLTEGGSVTLISQSAGNRMSCVDLAENTGVTTGTQFNDAAHTHDSNANAKLCDSALQENGTYQLKFEYLTRGINLSQSDSHTFPEVTEGYGAQTEKEITVTNTGTGLTGDLTVELSGTNADDFTLSKNSIGSIAVGGHDTFSVVPNTGLTAGTYTATVTVSGSGITPQSFEISFTVNDGLTAIDVPSAVTGLIYNGTAQTGVNAGTGYTISGTSKATNFGSYNAIVSLIEGYKWSGTASGDQTINWSIAKKAPAAGDFTFISPTNLIYDENAKSASLMLKSPFGGIGTITPKYYKDSMLVSEAKAAGTYIVKFDIAEGTNFTSASDFSDASYTFTIMNANQEAPAGLGVAQPLFSGGKGKITGTTNELEYTGEPITPSIRVYSKSDNEELSSSNYKVEYSNNVNGGQTAKVTVTGIGRYSRSISKDFSIKKKDISGSNIYVSNVGSAVKNGYPSSITVKFGSKELIKGTDYQFEGGTLSSSVVGSQKGSVNIIGLGNFGGRKNFTFDVAEKNIYDAVVSPNPISSTVSYNGYVQEPSFYVTLEGSPIYKNNQYTVSYRKTGTTVDTSQPKDAGIYSVYLVGKYPACGGEKYIGTFTINAINTANVTATATQASTSSPLVVTVKSKYDNVTFTQGKDYTVTPGYIYNGKGTATITPIDGSNLTGSAITVQYTVNGKNIAYCSAEFAPGSKQSNQYTGSAIKLQVKVRDGYTTLTEGTDYTVTYKDAAGKVVYSPIEAGTYTIVIESKGAYSGTKTMTFEIVGTDISGYTVTLKETSVNATGYSQTPVITSVKKGYYYSLSSNDYTVSYQDATGKTVYSMSAPGTYKVVVAGKNGYSGSTYATFRIVGTPQTVTVNQDSYKVYPTSDSFKITAKATGDGTGFTYTSSNPAVASVSSTGVVTMHKVGKAVITVATTGNKKSEPASKDVTVKVYPKKTALAKKPWTDGKKAQLKVRWNYQDGATKYQIRYSRDKNFKAGTYITKTVNAHGKDYTTQSTTLTKLKSGYTHYVKVRAVYTDPVTGDNYYGSWSGWRSAKTI